MSLHIFQNLFLLIRTIVIAFSFEEYVQTQIWVWRQCQFWVIQFICKRRWNWFCLNSIEKYLETPISCYFCMCLDNIIRFDSIHFHFVLTLFEFIGECRWNSENSSIYIVRFDFCFGFVNFLLVFANWPLNKNIVGSFMNETSADVTILLLTMYESPNLKLRYFPFVDCGGFGKLYKNCFHIVSTHSVQTHLGMSVHDTMETKIFSFHVKSTDGWMMAYLL